MNTKKKKKHTPTDTFQELSVATSEKNCHIGNQNVIIDKEDHLKKILDSYVKLKVNAKVQSHSVFSKNLIKDS